MTSVVSCFDVSDQVLRDLLRAYLYLKVPLTHCKCEMCDCTKRNICLMPSSLRDCNNKLNFCEISKQKAAQLRLIDNLLTSWTQLRIWAMAGRVLRSVQLSLLQATVLLTLGACPLMNLSCIDRNLSFHLDFRIDIDKLWSIPVWNTV